MDSGHKPRTPIARPVDWRRIRIGQDDKRRQVLVLGPESIGHPRPQTRTPGDRRAGVHLAHAARMVDPVGPARPDHRDVINALRGMRQPVADPRSRLAVLLPPAFRGQQRRLNLPHRGDDALVPRRERLPREFVELRLGVEAVHLAGTALHEEEDHALGPRRKQRQPSLKRRRLCPPQRLRPEHPGQRQRPEPRPAVQQGLATVRQRCGEWGHRWIDRFSKCRTSLKSPANCPSETPHIMSVCRHSPRDGISRYGNFHPL